MKKLLSFDIEIYDDFPEVGPTDLSKIRPSIAATGTCENDIQFYYDEPFLSVENARKLVVAMQRYDCLGYKPFTWNGTAFDFQLLGLYTGMIHECAQLALDAIDGMLLVTFRKGWRLGLDAALLGAGLDSKTHTVTLKDGTEIHEMNGALAPKMWRDGEIEAVKTYLKGDILQPLKLGQYLESSRMLRWTSKAGRPQSIWTNMESVRELFALPEPDTSWMTDPPTRKSFVEWMPEDVLKANRIEV